MSTPTILHESDYVTITGNAALPPGRVHFMAAAADENSTRSAKIPSFQKSKYIGPMINITCACGVNRWYFKRAL